MKDVRHSIPGWIEAVALDYENHDLAYILPCDRIAGVTVRHMAFRDLLRLSAIGCPLLRNFPDRDEFLADKQLQHVAVIAVAYLRVGYAENRRLRNLWAIWRIGRIDRGKLYDGLRGYMERTFFNESSGGNGAVGDIRSYWSVATDIVDLFGREYGWTAEQSLTLPYRQAVQSCRRIIRRHNPKAHIHTKSDEVVYAYLEKLNSGAGEQ